MTPETIAADHDRTVASCGVRHAGLDDLDALAPLFDAYRVFYRQQSDLALARDYLRQRLMRHESVLLLAELDGKPAGLIQLYPMFCSIVAEPIWVLNDLYVADAARGRGVARALMTKACDHARASGAARIELSTAHGNRTAQALYESLGYELDTVYRYYSLSL
ncbi:N-acetyltransferase [Jeongeupia sp. HS-3]|uniref:GNAT family N-acetyltransferase n=1 Tax=Jeongeupia sp. HS-3 TaxID=1009682 RepID=UPI0018A3F0F0|nr:GNAT family N-acetyltransferase [Jeongeupia sp. HS-3]BCL76314.1 N-acetyltransferase [Jeongeupia sp. HS-3]